jgi:hypothetical protein
MRLKSDLVVVPGAVLVQWNVVQWWEYSGWALEEKKIEIVIHPESEGTMSVWCV